MLCDDLRDPVYLPDVVNRDATRERRSTFHESALQLLTFANVQHDGIGRCGLLDAAPRQIGPIARLTLVGFVDPRRDDRQCGSSKHPPHRGVGGLRCNVNAVHSAPPFCGDRVDILDSNASARLSKRSANAISSSLLGDTNLSDSSRKPFAIDRNSSAAPSAFSRAT